MVAFGRALTVLAVVCALVACETGNPFARQSQPVADEPKDGAGEPMPVPDTGLALSSEQRFSDIPLPVGLSEDPERTFVYQRPDLAVGRMVYTTRATVAELAQFYLEEAPLAGWEKQSVTQDEGAELVFTKPDKRLEVTIRPLSFGRGRRLVLTLLPEAR
jgi:hypothetical protein